MLQLNCRIYDKAALGGLQRCTYSELQLIDVIVVLALSWWWRLVHCYYVFLEGLKALVSLERDSY